MLLNKFATFMSSTEVRDYTFYTAMKMEATWPSETSVPYHGVKTQRNATLKIQK
jgi:hypothetical protein